MAYAYILFAIIFCIMVALIVLNMMESRDNEQAKSDEKRLKDLVDVITNSKK